MGAQQAPGAYDFGPIMGSLPLADRTASENEEELHLNPPSIQPKQVAGFDSGAWFSRSCPSVLGQAGFKQNVITDITTNHVQKRGRNWGPQLQDAATY